MRKGRRVAGKLFTRNHGHPFGGRRMTQVTMRKGRTGQRS